MSLLRSVLFVSLFAVSSALVADAAPGVLSLAISDESGPPGSIVQVKISVTEPTPISTSAIGISFDRSMIDSIDGIAAFSPAGDVTGTALVRNGSVQVHLFSPSGSFGNQIDYPILTFAVTIRRDALPGSRVPVHLAPGALFLTSAGSAYSAEVAPGSITAGGSLSIGNVTPGEGLVPAGVPVRITGTGFSPGTRFAVDEAKIDSVRILSSTAAELVFRGPVSMAGRRIRASNAAGDKQTYYSYLRPAISGASANALLNQTVPLFPSDIRSSASLRVPCAGSGVECGLAFLNPSSQPVTVHMTASTLNGKVTASVPLPARSRLTRTLAEMFGTVPPLASVLDISASGPVHMMGLVADAFRQTVLPFPIH